MKLANEAIKARNSILEGDDATPLLMLFWRVNVTEFQLIVRQGRNPQIWACVGIGDRSLTNAQIVH